MGKARIPFIFISFIFFKQILVSDVLCIYNETKDALSIEKIKTGPYILEHLVPAKNGGTDRVETLSGEDNGKITIGANEGFLMEYTYGYLEDKGELVLTLRSRKPESKEIELRVLSNEPVSQQNNYQISQQVIGASPSQQPQNVDKKWWLLCDKLVVILENDSSSCEIL